METDPRFVAKVISASCVLIIWSYFPSVISMSLLLRTEQDMGCHSIRAMKLDIIMCFIK
jgi:hypothetical protein